MPTTVPDQNESLESIAARGALVRHLLRDEQIQDREMLEAIAKDQHVSSVEVLPNLARDAQKRLARLGYHNVEVHNDDGYRGWPAGAPYDRIIVTAAPPELPAALVEQLVADGILVAPVGPALPIDVAEQRLLRWQKQGKDLLREDLGAVRFVPMVSGR